MNSPEMKITKFGMENVIATSAPTPPPSKIYTQYNGFVFRDTSTWQDGTGLILKNYSDDTYSDDHTTGTSGFYDTYDKAYADIANVKLVVDSGLSTPNSNVGDLLNMMKDGTVTTTYNGVYKYVDNDGQGIRFEFVRSTN